MRTTSSVEPGAPPLGDARWARARSQWMPQDGLVARHPATKPMLDTQRLGARPYSLSALQKFATCPYQFLLSAIYRLEPDERAGAAAEAGSADARLDLPRSAGRRSSASCKREGRLPLTAGAVPHALQLSTRRSTAVAAAYEERLAPAIDRVWRDEIAAIGRDLRVWVRRLPRGRRLGARRTSSSASGLPDDGDAIRQRARSGLVDGRFMLRGSVDLDRNPARVGGAAHHRPQDGQEPHDTADGDRRRRDAAAGALRPGDRADRWAAGRRRAACSTARRPAASPITGFRSTNANRRAGLEALEIIDRAIELGFLPAAPARTRVHVVRLPAGLRPGRTATRRRASARISSAISTALREMP